MSSFVSSVRRYVLKQVKREKTQTSFRAMLYWTAGGDGVTAAEKEQWEKWLSDSLQALREVLTTEAE